MVLSKRRDEQLSRTHVVAAASKCQAGRDADSNAVTRGRPAVSGTEAAIHRAANADCLNEELSLTPVSADPRVGDDDGRREPEDDVRDLLLMRESPAVERRCADKNGSHRLQRETFSMPSWVCHCLSTLAARLRSEAVPVRIRLAASRAASGGIIRTQNSEGLAWEQGEGADR